MDYITSELELEVDSDEFNEVLRLSVLCISKCITAFEFQHSMKAYTKGRSKRLQLPSAKNFRLNLINSRYTSLSLKLFCLRLGKMRKKVLSVDEVKPIAQEYRIKVRDAKRILRLWNTSSSLRSALKSSVVAIPENSIQWDESALVELFGQMYLRLRKHAAYFVRKKLRFACMANNLGTEDIVNDLLAHAWSRYMQVVPTDKEPLHLLNSLKLCIVNEINNLCDKYSTMRHGRLKDLGNDKNAQSRSTLIVVSENQLPNFSETGKFYDSLGAVDPFARFETSLSIERVLNSKTCLGDRRKQTLLKILLGAVDPNFTAWLRDKGYATQQQENDDIQECTSPETFNRLLARYLKVPHDKVVGFLHSVGTSIAPELSRKVS